MRSFRLSRDKDNRVYAEDEHATSRFYFARFPEAVSENTAIQEIIAQELVADLRDFVAWIAEEYISFLPNTLSLD